MTSYNEIVARWEARRADPLGAKGLVVMADVAAEVLSDLSALKQSVDAELLSREQAADIAGCHPDSISRAIRHGRLPNFGTSHSPRVRRSDLRCIAGRKKDPSRRAGDTRTGVSSGASASSSAAAVGRQVIATRMHRNESR